MKKKKKRIVPDTLSDLSSYPLQAACTICGHQDQGPVSGEGGLCILCCTVARIKAEALAKASRGASLPSPRAKGAEEPPKARSGRPLTYVLVSGGKGPPVVAKRSRGDLPFSVYRLFRDQSSGRVCAAPISPP